MVANNLSHCFIVIISCSLFAECKLAVLHAEDPHFQEVQRDGKVVQAYFYGPASWLSEPGERLDRYPELESIILRCGKVNAEQLRYLATRKSIDSVGTMEIDESNAVVFEIDALNELSKMTWLRVLRLHSHPLPEGQWTFLSKLRSLEELTLEGIDEQGLEHLVDMKQLRALDLVGDSFQCVPPVLSTLTGLETLSLDPRADEAPVLDGESIRVLTPLTNLCALSIDGIDSEGIKQLGSLSHLQYLWIGVDDQHVRFEPIEKLECLTSLSISIKRPNEFNLDFLKELKNLEFLQLFGSISPYSRENFPSHELSKVKTLVLTSQLEYQMALNILNMQNLKSLSVRGISENTRELIPRFLDKKIKLKVY